MDSTRILQLETAQRTLEGIAALRCQRDVPQLISTGRAICNDLGMADALCCPSCRAHAALAKMRAVAQAEGKEAQA